MRLGRRSRPARGDHFRKPHGRALSRMVESKTLPSELPRRGQAISTIPRLFLVKAQCERGTIETVRTPLLEAVAGGLVRSQSTTKKVESARSPVSRAVSCCNPTSTGMAQDLSSAFVGASGDWTVLFIPAPTLGEVTATTSTRVAKTDLPEAHPHGRPLQFLRTQPQRWRSRPRRPSKRCDEGLQAARGRGGRSVKFEPSAGEHR